MNPKFLLFTLAFTITAACASASPADTTAAKPKKLPKLKELPDPKTVGYAKNVQLGDKLFEMGSLYNGLQYYEEALNKKPGKTVLYQRMADGNFSLRDYKNANKYYKLIVDLDTAKHDNLYSLYQLALSYKYIGNYEEAKANFQLFNQYAQSVTSLDAYKKKAEREIKGCDLAISFRTDTAYNETKIKHLDANVNQPFTDYSPVTGNDGALYYGSLVSDKVILTGKREKYATFSRIYTSKRNGDSWTKAEIAPGNINTVEYHTGNPAFTADGKTMYYTQCLQDEMQRMRCHIYKSTLTDTGWVAGAKLDADINKADATNTQPAIGKNEAGETVLYFVSDRNKDKGLDIFYAKLSSSGSFDKAREVSGINTDGDEMTPFYDYQTDALYFSSNGHVNIGGNDIYKVKPQHGGWTAPENAGLPINSSVDDMYFNWKEKEGYGFVVSNRAGGFGLKSETCCDDIYYVYRYRIFLAVRGTIVDADSNNTLLPNQVIVLSDATTGKEIKSYTSKDGNYFFDLEPGKSYKATAVREGYFTAVTTFNTIGREKSDTLYNSVSFKRMEKGKAYTLNNIYYEFDKAELTPSSKGVLDMLYGLLQENPNIVIELSAHTDSKGADKYNLDLSQKRAESCVNYLIKEKGVSPDRIIAKGYGETVPVAPNTNTDGSDNEIGRAKNRRTEFKIVGEVGK